MSQRQHYVPQFYLRGWTTGGEGLVWVYRKGQRPRPLSIAKRVGQEPDFYAFTDSSGVYDSRSVEKKLEKLDDAAASVLQKITERAALTAANRELLSRFISVQWRRVPKHREAVNNRLKDLMPSYFDGLREDIAALRASGRSPERLEESEARVLEIQKQYMERVPDYFFTRNIERASIFEELLVRMDWAFLQTTADSPFLTCDAPVLSNVDGTGLGDPQNGIVLFPLSKDLMLQGMWVTTFRGAYVRIPDEHVRRFNRYVVEAAHREVYASVKSAGFTTLVNKRMRN
jgi:Protein of unknown function (DUF4238)